jgi:hypothetical protein
MYHHQVLSEDITEAIHYSQTLPKIINKFGHVFIILMIPFESFRFLKWNIRTIIFCLTFF